MKGRRGQTRTRMGATNNGEEDPVERAEAVAAAHALLNNSPSGDGAVPGDARRALGSTRARAVHYSTQYSVAKWCRNVHDVGVGLRAAAREEHRAEQRPPARAGAARRRRCARRRRERKQEEGEAQEGGPRQEGGGASHEEIRQTSDAGGHGAGEGAGSLSRRRRFVVGGGYAVRRERADSRAGGGVHGVPADRVSNGQWQI